MRTKVWQTKTGQRIRIMDMETTHIQNCVAFLYRAALAQQNEAICNFPSFQGEMAQMYAEQEWDSIAQARPEDYALQCFPIIEDLEKELEDREQGKAGRGIKKTKKLSK